MPYLSKFLQGQHLSKKIIEAGEILEELNLSYDTIAVRGVSGLLFGAPLAMHLKKNLLISRKKGERSHSGWRLEGSYNKTNGILIIDDFIDSGSTLRKIYKDLIQHVDTPRIVGVGLYDSSRKEEKLWEIKKGITLPLFALGNS